MTRSVHPLTAQKRCPNKHANHHRHSRTRNKHESLSEAQGLKSFLGNACHSHVLCQGTEKALENSCFRSRSGGPQWPVGRIQGPHPTSFRALLPLPVLNLGAASEDLTGTKCKPFIWANVPTLQMRKLRPYEAKGCACQHHSA